MRQQKAQQRRLAFPNLELWRQIPQKRREQCRQLLRRLLLEVVLEETRQGRVDHE